MILLAGRDSPPEESKIKIGENRQAKRACSFSGSSYSLFIFAILPIFAKPSIFAIFVCQPPWKEHRLDTSHLRHRAPKPQGNRADSPLPADFPLPSALPSGRSPFFSFTLPHFLRLGNREVATSTGGSGTKANKRNSNWNASPHTSEHRAIKNQFGTVASDEPNHE